MHALLSAQAGDVFVYLNKFMQTPSNWPALAIQLALDRFILTDLLKVDCPTTTKPNYRHISVGTS